MSEYLEDLLSEVKKRLQESGTSDEAAFLSYIDEVVDEWISNGQLDEDYDTENLKEEARGMWESIQSKLLDAESE